MALFMGIDAGTQGVRCAAVDEKGNLVAARRAAFRALNASTEENRYEQRPEDWESALREALGLCLTDLKSAGHGADEIEALSIDGTSGTIVPLDGNNAPLTNAIMYNDPRAKEQAARAHAAMGDHEQKLGLTFGASFSLPRAMWLRERAPAIYEKTAAVVHQADYVAGLLCGEYRVSDYSNALKTGYDLIADAWPRAIETELGLDLGKFPKIVAPGAPVAPVSRAAAEKFGLSTRTMVVGGSTDGYASALSAGAVSAGDWASIIGTTLVLKGVTERLILDPSGSAYSHRLPSGEWMLGGAGNVGGRCLNEMFPGGDFASLDRQAEALIPTGARCYPLTGRGERFPYVLPGAEGFCAGNIYGGRLYPALMEGVGFVERLAFERMIEIGCPVGDEICVAGGASKSGLWLRIRAAILNRRLKVPGDVDASVGSALLAASGRFGSLRAAAAAMIRYTRAVEPDANLAARYDEIYRAFRGDVQRMYGV